MSLSKKDYEHIASILRAEHSVSTFWTRYTVENITASLADLFAQDKKSFDRKKFYQAALGRDTVRKEES